MSKITVGSIVYVEDREGRVLVQRRSGGALSGYIGLPGGKVELGEGCVEAGVRELEEETGLKASDARLVGAFSEVSYYKGKLNGHYVLFVIVVDRFEGSFTKDTKEGENLWVKKTQIPSLGRVLPDLYFVLESVKRAPFVEHLVRHLDEENSYVLTTKGEIYPKRD
ncbi:hypothetical protein B9Q02_06760 [Candidatus Marsarchaeota G1 archaeon BE_D]|uniref:Nudix hydrolase domain-containing protein n=2 Tax=Candidatus Marsarchaeota group 1 TaxID=2203770 RepID=A0A2R6AGA0_9ARCH|nr:MAG: hypothetical protein B9Q02_06760 [Candidatus Marsarchaeota G1 archaeon BE_D]